LAAGASSYLVNNAAAVNDQLYIVSATGPYLDQRLADYGITRPSNVGLSDEIFSALGIQIKNRKQVRDLMNNLLDDMFGDEFVKAIDRSTAYEPYALADGDTLIINFDEAQTSTITFTANQFVNINAALAQEVADAITTSLLTLGHRGIAIANNVGSGNFVELISDTIGPASSVTVLGGSAQDELLFPSIVSAGGNASTQWTLSLQNGGIIRFTWTGGSNPNTGKVDIGDYVNIYGGGFTSSTNEGTFPIIDAVGGTVDNAYFEVENPLGTSGIVTQGIDNAILFFSPVRKTLASMQFYAAIYQTQSAILQIFLPATTSIITRSRLGSAHIHYPPNVGFNFHTNPNPGDVFSITTLNSFVAGTDFVIGATTEETVANFVPVINTIVGVDAVAGDPVTFPELPPAQALSILTIYQDTPNITLTGTYTGAANIVPSGFIGDVISVQPNQPGPYGYDLNQNFTVSYINTTLTQNLDGTDSRVFTVANAADFPDGQGYLIFGYGTKEQEGPVPYIGRPSNNTLLISPVYTIQTPHPIGTTVTLVAQDSSVTITTDGTDYPFFVTDVVSGRVYAQELIQQVAATGITVIFTILYPSSLGLGGWANPLADEIAYVYGP
jgi:hypothetical protein